MSLARSQVQQHNKPGSHFKGGGELGQTVEGGGLLLQCSPPKEIYALKLHITELRTHPLGVEAGSK